MEFDVVVELEPGKGVRDTAWASRAAEVEASAAACASTAEARVTRPGSNQGPGRGTRHARSGK